MDLIDREALLKCLILNSDGKRIPEYDCDNFPITISLVEMKKIIRNQQKVEAKEVVYGEWIKGDSGEWTCSVCGEENCYAYDENLKRFTDFFCPNCGADMRKKV